MRERSIVEHFLRLSRTFPAVTVVGPRQSGKTTLCKACFPKHQYVSLENPDMREFARQDPLALIRKYPSHTIFDEVQHVPELFSYLQTHIDEQKKNPHYVLTGSHNFSLSRTVSQSLAGRTAILRLLPFSMREAYPTNRPGVDQLLFKGLYPAIFSRNQKPYDMYSAYVTTYIERDLRSMSEIRNLHLFRKFIKLCAARTGQILNASNLAADCGINHNTALAWLNILEAGFIIHLLRPHSNNFNKRLIKAPKLYFYDTGLAAYLLEIENAQQIAHHPLRGSLFETFVVSEMLKARYNRGKDSNLYYFRDNAGHEIDVIADSGQKQSAVEIKSGETFGTDFGKNLVYYRKLNKACEAASIVYGGETLGKFHDVDVLRYDDFVDGL